MRSPQCASVSVSEKRNATGEDDQRFCTRSSASFADILTPMARDTEAMIILFCFIEHKKL